MAARAKDGRVKLDGDATFRSPPFKAELGAVEGVDAFGFADDFWARLAAEAIVLSYATTGTFVCFNSLGN